MRIHFHYALYSLAVFAAASASASACTAQNRQADSKTVTAKTGETHFEAPLPSGIPLRLYLRSGDIRLVGTDDNKISVDVSGKNADEAREVKHRLVVQHGTAEFRLSGGPRNDFQIIVHLPKNSDLFLRVPAGDVTVEGITGDKDIELHAGDLSIHVGNPNEYSQVDASVIAGDVSASPFGESRSGLFRSFRKSGSGRYKLHAHVGAGDLTLL